MLLDRVVIGSTLEAVYYALINDCFFVSNRKTPPLFYREDSQSWPKLNFMMGLLSKAISFENTETIRIVEDSLKISAENTIYKYQFGTCYVFDSTGIQLENDIIETNPDSYTVLDDFELSTMGEHRYEIPPVTNGEGLAGEIHFYSSERVDGSNYITDCIVESELSKEQINSFDYSDTIVRFLVERHLASVGVHGSFMEFYKSGKPKYRKPKVKHVKRLIFSRDNNVYTDTEFVKMMNLSMEEIIEEATKG